MTDASGATTWTYGDVRGRLTKESRTVSGSGGGTFTTEYTYDAADLLRTLKYPDGETVTTGYLPQMLVDSVVGSATYVQQTQYNASGRVELRKLGADQVRTDYVYNPWTAQEGRLQVIKSGPPANPAALQNLTYAYSGDNRGNVTGITEALAGPQTQSFTYDTLDRLKTAVASGGSGGTYGQVTYAYDANGRLLNGPRGNGYVYHAAKKHAVTAVGSNSYTYDANGNMTKRTVGGQTFTLVYDAENRLVQVSGAATASFVYDGDGNRVKGTVGGVTTVYIGGAYEQSGSVVKKYYQAGGQTVAMRDAGTLRWLLSDHLGSSAVTVTGTAATGDLRYHPFGATRYTSGVTPTSRRFTGQREEGTLGLYFYGARWYDPSLGRFVQPDTLVPQPGDAADWDRFAYVRNNPLKYTDPTGHVAVCFRGAPNSSKDDSAPDIVHQLCRQALEDAGYDEGVHGEILYFHYNNLKHIRQAFEAIMARPAGEPAIVMGHSWGGAASLRLAHELKYYGDYLRSRTLVNEELAANTQIDLLITIDPERFGRVYTPKRVPDNVDFAMNIAPKDGWNFSSYPGQGGKDNGPHGLINAQNGTNKIQGALNIDLEYVATAQTGEVRMNHDTIVNLTAHTGEPPVINPVTQQYMTMSISAYVQ